MFAIQDGQHFFLYATATQEDPDEVVRCPLPVNGDFDLLGAKRARHWFRQSRPEVDLS